MNANSKQLMALVFGALASACGPGEVREAAPSGTSPTQKISDQAHNNGMAGFFFLPPTVLQVPPAFTGTFDPGVKAVARVCKGTGACDSKSSLALFSASGGTGGGELAKLRVLPTLQAYTATWDTRKCVTGACSLAVGGAYRLHVYATTPTNAEVELGYADLQVMALPPPKPDTSNFSPLVKNLPYVIAFRVEKPTNPCAGVVCAPADQCHDAGVCNSSDGRCSNPPKADGAACSDGNACTQSDSCRAGSCIGANPVPCTEQDQCHDIGVCNPTTGTCSNPPKPDGWTCDDGDPCTQADSCQSGACDGASPVTCSAMDQCHQAGNCDSLTGLCSNPAAPNGTSCADGNACTQVDACQAGACVGASPVMCAAADQCHGAGSCDPLSGSCTSPALADGTACSDGDACTLADTCRAGACVGADPVTCAATDRCHLAGICDQATGQCTSPPMPQGTSCSDGNSCNGEETCDASGSCIAGAQLELDDGDPCTTDSCDPMVGIRHAEIPSCRMPRGVATTAVTLDAEVPVITRTVGLEGATIFGPPGTPLEGVTVVFPPDAVRDEAQITLGYKTGSVMPAVGTWGGLVLTIRSSGATEFEWPVFISMPVVDPSGTVVPYYLDAEKTLYALPVLHLDQAAGAVEFLTFHASDFLTIESECELSELGGPGGEAIAMQGFTGFRRSRDGFFIENKAVQPSPDGMCLGMSTFSLWYYMKRPQLAPLYDAFRETIDDSMEAAWRQGFWKNHFASLTIQDLVADSAQSRANRYWLNYLAPFNRDPGSIPSDEQAFCAIRQSIVNQNHPTVLALYGSSVNHAVLAYGYDGTRIYIYDPNKPGRFYSSDEDSVLELVTDNRTWSWKPYSNYPSVLPLSTAFGVDGAITNPTLSRDFLAILNEANQHFAQKFSLTGTVVTPTASLTTVKLCRGAIEASWEQCVEGGYSTSQVTSASGEYRFDNLPDGAYVVEPSASGVVFHPAKRLVVITGRPVMADPFVSIVPTWASVGAGRGHTVAVKSDGSLWAWGENPRGQVGNGTVIEQASPVQIDEGFKKVAAGDLHSAGIKLDGSLWTWGDNSCGQLGEGTTETRTRPVYVGDGFIAVAAGYLHNLAVRADGSLWAWGCNGVGQLGDGTTENRVSPVRIGSGYVAVAAGVYHSLAVKADGSLWAWGYNGEGELGDGTRIDRHAPVRIASSGFAAVAAGETHSLALATDGTLWAWGYGHHGALGISTSGPQLAPAMVGGGYSAVAAGAYHTVALRRDRTLWAWGYGNFGQLGTGRTGNEQLPVQVGSGFATIAAGRVHTVGVMADGTLWSWGANFSGQLGDGTTMQQLLPEPIESPFSFSHSLSGTVYGNSGAPVMMALCELEASGVGCAPAGFTAMATTDESGRYEFTGLPVHNYLITPALAGYGFSPPSRTVTEMWFSSGHDFVARRQSAAVDMGTLGGPNSAASAVSSSGQVVGWSELPDGGTHAFSWTQAGGMLDLGTLGGATSGAVAVNSAGRVVGSSAGVPGAYEQWLPFSWTETEGMVVAGSVCEGWGEATAVNANGQVVGQCGIPIAWMGMSFPHPFSWTAESGFVDFMQDAPFDGLALAINDAGTAVGHAANPWGEPSPALFLSGPSGGSWLDLGFLDGSAPGAPPPSLQPGVFRFGEARGINVNGQVVGVNTVALDVLHAFSWTSAGGMIDLGTLGGGTSNAVAVNSQGLVIGDSSTVLGETHAFIWTEARGMRDLGTLGGPRSTAAAINASGIVVGESTTANGESHAYAWSEAGGMVDLGRAGQDSAAGAISDGGMVVGWATDVDGSQRATIWRLGSSP